VANIEDREKGSPLCECHLYELNNLGNSEIQGSMVTGQLLDEQLETCDSVFMMERVTLTIQRLVSKAGSQYGICGRNTNVSVHKQIGQSSTPYETRSEA